MNEPNELGTLIDQITDLNDFRDNANIALRCIDQHGKITWANQAELDLLGYSNAEYIGSAMASHHSHPLAAQKIMEIMDRDGVIIDYPATFKKADGALINVLINSSIYKRNGEFVHTRCVTRNITEAVDEGIKSASLLNEMKRNQQMLYMALDAASMGTWDMSLVTLELQCSDHCRHILGVSENEEINTSLIEELIEPQDLEKLRTGIREAIRTGDRVTIEFRIRRFKGEEFRFLQLQGKAYYDKNGKVERCFGTLIDLTESIISTEKSAK